MIQTSLFNQLFEVIRNNPTNVNGIIEDDYIETGIFISGRISQPSIRERNLFQSREMNLTAVIYCEPYAYDEKKDVLIKNDVQYEIKEIVPTRDRDGNVSFLKIFADESNISIDISES